MHALVDIHTRPPTRLVLGLRPGSHQLARQAHTPPSTPGEPLSPAPRPRAVLLFQRFLCKLKYLDLLILFIFGCVGSSLLHAGFL